MSKHTPGPWKVCATKNSFFVDIIDSNGEGVVLVRHSSNARLIAAAPDLLAAAKALVIDLPWSPDGQCLVKEDLMMIISKLQEAVYKAEEQ